MEGNVDDTGRSMSQRLCRTCSGLRLAASGCGQKSFVAKDDLLLDIP